jgi:hypothetical protein
MHVQKLNYISMYDGSDFTIEVRISKNCTKVIQYHTIDNTGPETFSFKLFI